MDERRVSEMLVEVGDEEIANDIRSFHEVGTILSAHETVGSSAATDDLGPPIGTPIRSGSLPSRFLMVELEDGVKISLDIFIKPAAAFVNECDKDVGGVLNKLLVEATP